jgi:tetratricopeptide (TPR) repeat protein/transcriptional regulator with XRE-family HTH domain
MSHAQVVAFAGILRQLRLAAGLTQEELADASGVAVRSISDLERGVNQTARKDTAQLLADGLGLRGSARLAFEAAARGKPAGADVMAPGVFSAAFWSGPRALPRDNTAFTGRQAELEQVTDALARAGKEILVIGGMAGVGKTTFAIHAAHRLAGQFPDGQVFIRLHAHTPGQDPVEPGEALASLLQVAGVVAARIPAGLEARTQMWRDHLAGKRMLLVLDDAAGHDQVQPLLPGTGGCLVIVTSRRHLTALDDAVLISLGILPPAEAGTLLTRLAGRPGLEAGDPAVAEIARLCGYLPLAIGMLARQLHHHPTWTAAGLAEDLAAARDRLDLMRAEDVSVAAAFDLSYRDVSTAEQRLFRLIGVHPGTDVDAYAASALAGTDYGLARAQLHSLYDHYLLMEPAAGRYQLHDLLRERARALAGRDPAGQQGVAMARLLGYYLYQARSADRFLARRASAQAYTADLVPPAQVQELASREEAVAWMEAERHNLEAAVGYAAAAGLPGYSASIAAAMHGFLRNQGHWTSARVLHKAALEAARAAGDELAEAGALTDLGTFQLDTGDAAAAITSHERALEVHRRLGHKVGEANALSHLADACRLTFDYQAALANYLSALELHRKLGNKLGEANAHRGLGAVAQATGDYQAAARNYDRALKLFRELGNTAGEARTINHLGHLARVRGDLAGSRAWFERSLEIATAIGSLPEKARAAEGVGEYYLDTGNSGLGLTYLRQALEIYQRLGSAGADRLQQAIEAASGR